jgi:hypothetical protein
MTGKNCTLNPRNACRGMGLHAAREEHELETAHTLPVAIELRRTKSEWSEESCSPRVTTEAESLSPMSSHARQTPPISERQRLDFNQGQIGEPHFYARRRDHQAGSGRRKHFHNPPRGSIRRGCGTGSRAIVASLGPGEICSDIAFLEKGRAPAAVAAKDENVEVDEIDAQRLRDLFESFPLLASRFYLSLALVLAQRLKDTSRELAREMW